MSYFFNRLLFTVLSVPTLCIGVIASMVAWAQVVSAAPLISSQSSTDPLATTSVDSPIDAKNNPNSAYAFGSYLGTGVYRAAEQNATVVSIPLTFDLQKDKDSRTWLRIPLSFGFFDYLARDLTEGELPSSVGTMTVTPGVEHHWQGSENTRMEAYFDLGFGTNFDTSDNVAIFASGVSSLYDFTFAGEESVWVSRLHFAGYSERIGTLTDQFAVLQSGVDIGLSPRWQWWNIQVQPRIFAIGYWYFNELNFSSNAEEDTLVSGSYEIGATLAFSKPLGGDLLGVDRIGLSYRTGDGLDIWRLVFSFPI
ncbi:hypothetical protein [Shewanella sp.]|uniref:hypothetical protein n=1 Tax=Shewanella sp. TaxID=50422 RepID=UPI00261EA4A9|nr:hypothetical protein [Shewanella sp.]